MRIGAGGPFKPLGLQDNHAPASIGEDDAGWGVVSNWVGTALRIGAAALTVAVGIAQANVNNQTDEIPKAPSVEQPTGQAAFSQRGQFQTTFVSFVGGDDIVPAAAVFRPDEQDFSPPAAAKPGPNIAAWPVLVDDDIVPIAAAFRPEDQDFTPPTAASTGPNIAAWPVSVDDDIVPVAAAFRPEEQDFTPPTAARADTNSAVRPVFNDDEIVAPAVAFRPDEQEFTPPTAAKFDPNIVVWLSGLVYTVGACSGRHRTGVS